MDSALKLRLLTGFCLLAAFWLSLAVSPLVFVILCGLVLFVSAWEWAPLGGQDTTAARLVLGCILLLLFLPLAVALARGQVGVGGIDTMAILHSLLVAVMFVWLFLLLAVLRAPRWPSSWLGDRLVLIASVPTLLGALAALLYLRVQPSGVSWILYSVVLVAAADIGAYFCGKRWVKANLHPT